MGMDGTEEREGEGDGEGEGEGEEEEDETSLLLLPSSSSSSSSSFSSSSGDGKEGDGWNAADVYMVASSLFSRRDRGKRKDSPLSMPRDRFQRDHSVVHSTSTLFSSSSSSSYLY